MMVSELPVRDVVMVGIIGPHRFKIVKVFACMVGNFAIKLSPGFLKKAMGILQSPPSICPSITLTPPKPLDEIQPNLVCELLA